MTRFNIPLLTLCLATLSCGPLQDDASNLDDDVTPIDTAPMPDEYSDSGHKFLTFDTGTGKSYCSGEWMTPAACQTAHGIIDDSFIMDCHEGEEQYCCLQNQVAQYCGGECTAAWRCQARLGTIVDGYCLKTYLSCCEGAAPAPPVPSGSAFTLADCPVVDPPTIAQQPSKLAGGICVEMHGADGDYFCPQEDYDRIALELERINEAFPVMLRDWGGQQWNLYGNGEIPFGILCGIDNGSYCDGVPHDAFGDLMTCFGWNDLQCLFKREGLCGIGAIYFDVAVNTAKVVTFFEEHVQDLKPGGYCELDKFTSLTNPLNGYHVENLGSDTWFWSLRSTAQHGDDFIPNCDVRINFATQPGTAAFLAIQIENLSIRECTIPEFLEL